LEHGARDILANKRRERVAIAVRIQALITNGVVPKPLNVILPKINAAVNVVVVVVVDQNIHHGLLCYSR